MVPLDRIQDVSISQNCCQRFWGVTDLGVETASGGKGPEIMLMAVKNPHKVRDEIIARRDQVAKESNGTDGLRALLTKASSINGDAIADDSNAAKELKTMNETLSRIEKLLEMGMQNLGHGHDNGNGNNGSVQIQDKIDHNEGSESSSLLH
jgi:uncharacterized membrane protein YdbT with pleckstrin-like domain